MASARKDSSNGDSSLLQARLQVLRDEMQELLRTLSRLWVRVLCRPHLASSMRCGPGWSRNPAWARVSPRLCVRVSRFNEANREKQAELFSSSPRAFELTLQPTSKHPAPVAPDAGSLTPFSIE